MCHLGKFYIAALLYVCQFIQNIYKWHPTKITMASYMMISLHGPPFPHAEHTVEQIVELPWSETLSRSHVTSL